MSLRRGAHEWLHNAENGVGGFLRSLLSGIPWSERAEPTESFELPAPASGTLRLHNPNGRTRVCGEDRDNIEVKALKCVRAESEEAAKKLLEQIRIENTPKDGALGLEVGIPKRWNRRGHVFLEVRVPRGTRVEVSAVNGRIDIEGIRGHVSARSSNGSANIADVIGDIEIATSNAKVSCACTRGRLVARSSNGKIVLEGHHGSIDASTSNGLITVSLDELGDDGIQLATSNGRIALRLPDDVDADIDLRVDNGIIRNDRTLCSPAREGNGIVRGKLGVGGALIKLRTSNGSISLR